MPDTSIVKSAFREQHRLHELGFSTWYGKVWELAHFHGLDLNEPLTKSDIKKRLKQNYITSWHRELSNIDRNPILRMYKNLKLNFELEPYLDSNIDPKFRVAITKLRASSHTLEIERGRYTRPTTDICQRLCRKCKCVEDEFHFLMECAYYNKERTELINEVQLLHPDYATLREQEAFIFLMTNANPQVMALVGKFIHKAFKERAIAHQFNISDNK